MICDICYREIKDNEETIQVKNKNNNKVKVHKECFYNLEEKVEE